MAPSHYVNQCWNMVNGTLRNKLQWNINRNSCIFIQENSLENVVCEMVSILSRPQCVNAYSLIAIGVTVWLSQFQENNHAQCVRMRKENLQLNHQLRRRLNGERAIGHCLKRWQPSAGPGDCLNMKMPSDHYEDSHYQDKTVSRSSQL